MIRLGELARRLGLATPAGHGDLSLHRLAPLDAAGPDCLSFMTGRGFLDALRHTRAACVMLAPEWASEAPVPVLCCDDPYLMYARASRWFRAEPAVLPGVHLRACVDPGARLGRDVSIGPGACVEPGAEIGDGSVLGAGVFVGAGACIGARSRLYPGVVVYHAVRIGCDCIVHANTVIGADGFGFARGPDGWEKIHQLGTVVIGDGVELGASVSIDRGALGDTEIGDGVIIDDQVHIAHNCRIGARTAIAGCSGLAGSTRVGADCTFAGQVGVSGHLEICDNAHFTGQARVTGSIREPGSYSSGTPLERSPRWRRNAVRFSQLEALQRRVRALEAALSQRPGAVPSGKGNEKT